MGQHRGVGGVSGRGWLTMPNCEKPKFSPPPSLRLDSDKFPSILRLLAPRKPRIFANRRFCWRHGDDAKALRCSGPLCSSKCLAGGGLPPLIVRRAEHETGFPGGKLRSFCRRPPFPFAQHPTASLDLGVVCQEGVPHCQFDHGSRDWSRREVGGGAAW